VSYQNEKDRLLRQLTALEAKGAGEEATPGRGLPGPRGGPLRASEGGGGGRVPSRGQVRWTQDRGEGTLGHIDTCTHQPIHLPARGTWFLQSYIYPVAREGR
jgi:hypothetical protein